VNNNFMRPGQHKNNNNRNRNRNNNNNNNRRNTGGGGSPNNKVFDSNGPDVKLRGTTQTIAEKYMQMGRDAQSSGDSVAAESYYQHAEHYYRLWAASQPVGQSLVMPRKLGEEEYDEDGEQINNDEEAGVENGNAESPQQAEGAEPFEAGNGDPNVSLPLAEGQQRNNRNNNYNNNRDNNNRNNNNRNRWQNRRNDRYDNNGNQDGNVAAAPIEGSAPVTEIASAAPVVAQVEHSGQWEAPSFLQRPTPVVSEAPVAEAMPEAETAAPRRVRAPRKPRVDADVAVAPEGAQSDE
jgi:Domain of unknown function (DUF4167)